MKVWKILCNDRKVNKDGIACYVKIDEKISDGSYKALQLARKKIDKSLCGIQLLDIERGEQMEMGIPVLEIL